MKNSGQWVTAREAEAITGLSARTLSRMAGDGKVQMMKDGVSGWRRFYRPSLETLGVDVPSDPLARVRECVSRMKDSLTQADDTDADAIGITSEWFLLVHAVSILERRITLMTA